MATPNLFDVQVCGRQFHYVEKGTGQPVIFIHGSLGDYRSWQFQIGPFSNKYRAISYSRRFAFPNKRSSNDISDNTIEGNAADLAELIRKFDIAPAHLIGHSFGAFIALYCAHRYPELVRTLVLCEPSVMQLLANSRDDGVQLLQSYKDNSKSAHEAFRNGDDEKAVRIILDVALGMQNVFDHIPEQTRMVLMDNVKGVQQELESEMTLAFNAQDAMKVNIVTLLVKGELSPRFFHRIIDILADNMPTTWQVMIPGVSHDLGRSTKPDIFNTTLMEFLARHG